MRKTLHGVTKDLAVGFHRYHVASNSSNMPTTRPRSFIALRGPATSRGGKKQRDHACKSWVMEHFDKSMMLQMFRNNSLIFTLLSRFTSRSPCQFPISKYDTHELPFLFPTHNCITVRTSAQEHLPTIPMILDQKHPIRVPSVSFQAPWSRSSFHQCIIPTILSVEQSSTQSKPA